MNIPIGIANNLWRIGRRPAVAIMIANKTAMLVITLCNGPTRPLIPSIKSGINEAIASNR